MTWTMLRSLELAALAVIAVGAHLWVVWLRRSLMDGLRELAGDVARDLARLSDLTAALIYVSFAAAAVPVGSLRPTSGEVDSVLDTIGLFALVVAVVEVATLFVLHRMAHHLEPWPPERVER